MCCILWLWKLQVRLGLHRNSSNVAREDVLFETNPRSSRKRRKPGSRVTPRIGYCRFSSGRLVCSQLKVDMSWSVERKCGCPLV